MLREIVKRFLILMLLATTMPIAVSAQPAPTTEQMVSVDPIRCWWRTSEGAVRIGEAFELTLTCAVLDNESVQVVPDESRLAGAVIAMAPYEVIASQHPADLRSGERRFFQYQYTMRIINPDAIGADVPIPIMTLHYRVNSRIAANASVQGRDLTYVLPPQAVRVLSLVTADAPDIRDSSNESFGIIESLTLRAGTLEVIAITLAALGALMVVVVLLRLLSGIRKREGGGKRLIGDYRLLARAGRELAAVQREADAGWNSTLLGRALAATRIAAASALGRPVSQRPVDSAAEAGDGRLVARELLGRKATALSGAATAEDLARALARMPATADAGLRQALEELQTALQTFGRAQYGREPNAERGELDSALNGAVTAVKRLKSRQMWPKPQMRRFTSRQPVVEHQA
jgi:hypothetical protein